MEIPTTVTCDGGIYTVTAIGVNAFANCDGLTGVTVPETVHYVGEGAFSGCTSLINISLGEGGEEIGSGAFAGCQAIEEVYSYNNEAPASSAVYSTVKKSPAAVVTRAVGILFESGVYADATLYGVIQLVSRMGRICRHCGNGRSRYRRYYQRPRTKCENQRSRQ